MRLLVFMLLLASQVSFAQSVMTVNGQTVSEAKVKAMEEVLKQRGIEDSKERSAIALGHIVQNIVLFQEAKKQKIDSDPALQLKIDDKRAEILTEALLEKNVYKSQPTEQQLKELYEQSRKNYNPNEIKVRQILVPSSQEAEKLIERINAGEDMAELARKYSIDSGSVNSGGEFPYVNVRAIAIPGFAQAAMMLQPGQVMPVPFESQQGYLVVRLEGKRQMPFPSFEKIKDKMLEDWRQKEATKYITKLLESAKIVKTNKKTKKNN